MPIVEGGQGRSGSSVKASSVILSVAIILAVLIAMYIWRR